MSIALLSDNPNSSSAVIGGLTQALSETVVETAKAQTYHWNVTGMAFGPLHALFQEIYEDHFAGQDTLAERIKALGGHADGRLSHSLETSRIRECDGAIPARRMLENLADDQKTLSSTFHDLARISEGGGDAVTSEIAAARANMHETLGWKLSAHLA